MKNILISSAVSIAIGFALGWQVRSATIEPETIKNTQAIEKKKPRLAPRNGNPLDVPPELLSPSDIDRMLDPIQPGVSESDENKDLIAPPCN